MTTLNITISDVQQDMDNDAHLILLLTRSQCTSEFGLSGTNNSVEGWYRAF